MEVLTTILGPWRERRTWLALIQVTTAIAVATVTFSVAVTSLSLLASSALLLPVLPLVAWATFAVSHGLANVERSRLAAQAELDLADPVPPFHDSGWRGWLRRIWERARSVPRWKEIAYLLAIFPVALLLGTLTLLSWSGSLAMILLPAYVSALPGSSAKLGPVEVGPGFGAFAVALLGLFTLCALAPRAAQLAARLETAMARFLLGPDPSVLHRAELKRLESSREAALGSAETERRRIERDLHDGAQQRLVALAVQLGAAQERLEDDPEAGKAMVAAAHLEAKEALAEIRDLVRGIHPVILEDRGLDAALSAVVARSTVPVELSVKLERRPSPAAESAAYFIVSEALTNVGRHSQASRADVTIVGAGNQLVIEVTDDGVGGADPGGGRGSGLLGLQQRVEGLGGRMHVLSPAGGPTSLIVELPCGS